MRLTFGAKYCSIIVIFEDQSYSPGQGNRTSEITLLYNFNISCFASYWTHSVY